MIIVTTIAVLATVGLIGALILFFAGKKFHVEEDPRIGQVQEILPGANCGGCGYPGCAGFACACVKASSLEGLLCPVGGMEVMGKVADVLGMAAAKSEPKIAVVRCNGNCEARERTNHYDGASKCAIASSLYGGETGCSFGCLGLGDCVDACDFDAIHINPETLLPEVVEDACVACGACVKACPKNIIELRKKGPRSRRIFVSCVNKDKGGVAKKSCSNACIGCSLCLKQCAFDAITIENNLSYIDHIKCRMCRKCVDVCPTHAIHELNFPPKPVKKDVAQDGDEKKAAPSSKPVVSKPSVKSEASLDKKPTETPKSETPQSILKENPVVVEKNKDTELPLDRKVPTATPESNPTSEVKETSTVVETTQDKI